MEKKRLPIPRTAALVAVSLGVLATGCNAAIGGGVLVVGVVAAALTYDCEEGIGVTVWDRTTAHPICDATVTASKDTTRVSFSPCYSLFLGEGTWTVTAEKPGFVAAAGTVEIPKKRHCAEPVYHSLELTLHPQGETRPMLPPAALPPPAPLPAAAPIAPAPAGSASPPAETAAPGPEAPSPAATAPPTGAFPPAPPETR